MKLVEIKGAHCIVGIEIGQKKRRKRHHEVVEKWVETLDGGGSGKVGGRIGLHARCRLSGSAMVLKIWFCVVLSSILGRRFHFETKTTKVSTADVAPKEKKFARRGKRVRRNPRENLIKKKTW